MASWLKGKLAAATASRSFARFVGLLESLGDRRANLLRVLTYHRVDEPDARPDLYPGLISATPVEFAVQMEYLSSRYRVIHMAEALDAVCGNGDLPPRAVLITFDDAYQDFAEHAWPILRRHSLPAALFVPTAYPGDPSRAFWWDRLYQAVCRDGGGSPLKTPIGMMTRSSLLEQQSALRRLLAYGKTLSHHQLLNLIDEIVAKEIDAEQFAAPSTGCVLSWEQLRRLADEGVTLAPHTQTHPLLNRVALEEARRQAVASREDLARETGDAAPVFAYPAGVFTDEVASMLGREGFRLAFTTCRGINDTRKVDPFRLRRVNVGRRTSQPLFRAQLLPTARHLNFCWPMPKIHQNPV